MLASRLLRGRKLSSNGAPCPPVVAYGRDFDRRRLSTIRKLVEVWAPPNENDTEAYARCVAKASGFGIDEPLDLHDHACLRPILTAMIRVENGRQPYSDAQIDAAPGDAD